MSSGVGASPGEDEDWIACLLPQSPHSTSAAIQAVAGALAAHYSFYVQREGLDN